MRTKSDWSINELLPLPIPKKIPVDVLHMSGTSGTDISALKMHLFTIEKLKKASNILKPRKSRIIPF